MNIKNTVLKAAKTTGLFLKKHKAEIMLGAGVAASVAGTVMACKSTLKVDDILKKAETDREKIEKARTELPEQYSEKDAKADLMKVKANTAVSLGKLYLPTAVLSVVGYGLIVGSHCVLKKEIRELTAEVAAVTASFLTYRNNVKKQFGEDVDRALLTGKKVNVNVDENGEITGTDISNNMSEAGRFVYVIDETTSCYDKNLDYYMAEVCNAERESNDVMNNLGFITVADVKRRMLGIKTKTTPAEHRYGWRKNPGTRDRKIAFEMPVKGTREYEELVTKEAQYMCVRLIPELDLYSEMMNPEYAKPENYDTWRPVQYGPMEG